MYKLAINRPILTLMFVLTLIIFGIISFNRLPVSLFPNVDFPIVTIKTTLKGADPKTVESKVTDKIEEKVSGIEGIDLIASTSAEGVSVVTVKFLLTRKIDQAANDIRDKVAAIDFASDVDKPIISKLDLGDASVINLFIAQNDQKITPSQMMTFVDQKIKPRLQKLSGVGAVNIVGFRERQIRILPDPYLMNKFGVGTKELSEIVSRQNVKTGGGRIIAQAQELVVKTEADAKSLEELKQLVIKPGVKLSDIAAIEDTVEDARSYANLNGKPGVMLEVQKISGENTIEVVKKVKSLMPEITKLCGSGYSAKLVNDTSIFILNSLHEVEFDLVYGALLAVLIVFLFLRNVTATLVSAITIPSSILGTFALMSYMGYSLDRMTLLGLTLAIGVLIDDAIVVIENIYKKLEHGMDNLTAALVGVKEIAFAVLTISSMLLAVFVPVAFMDGIVGKFFNSFALTVSFAVIISYIIAMTLIPSLSARVLSKGESRFYHATEPIFVAIDRAYVSTLRFVLRRKFLVIAGVFALLIASFKLLPYIGKEFIPKEDKAEFEVFIKAPVSVSMEQMTKRALQIQQSVAKNEHVVDTILRIGYTPSREINKAVVYVKIKDKHDRKVRQDIVMNDMRQQLKQFKDLSITVADIPNIRGAGVSVPYQLVLKSDSLESLSKASSAIMAHLGKLKGVVDIDSNFEPGKPEVTVNIIRENAQRAGVSASEIAQAVGSAFSGERAISKLDENGKQLDITLRLGDEERNSIDDLKKLQIHTSGSQSLFLDGLVKIEQQDGLAAIYRFDRQRQTTIYADLYKIVLGDAVAHTESSLKTLLPPDVTARFTGFAEEMQKTGKAMGFAFLLSFIIMYLLLAALFESLIQPLIIMVALPLSFIGAFAALFITAKTLNLFTMIGMMVLMGMVGKNAVLLIDFANQNRLKGMSIDESLLDAGEKRLRPILMTTLAIVFGMLPIAIGVGAGAETKSPMATTIIGGLLSSMFLTLLIVPALYRVVSPLDLWLRKFYERRAV